MLKDTDFWDILYNACMIICDMTERCSFNHFNITVLDFIYCMFYIDTKIELCPTYSVFISHKLSVKSRPFNSV